MSKRVIAGNSSVAIGYVRVSTGRQQLSPEAQRTSIERWARDAGVVVAAWHVESVCSVDAIEDRPALMAALASLGEHGAGVLAVAKRDRLARDVMLTAMIERAAGAIGAVVVSAAGEGNGASPADQFMRTVIDGAAQYERALIRARTKSALAVIRARGQKTGGSVPFGFALAEDGRTLVEVEAEQATIARARALRASLPLLQVARVLEGEGRVSRSGRPFAASQIARMVG